MSKRTGKPSTPDSKKVEGAEQVTPPAAEAPAPKPVPSPAPAPGPDTSKGAIPRRHGWKSYMPPRVPPSNLPVKSAEVPTTSVASTSVTTSQSPSAAKSKKGRKPMSLPTVGLSPTQEDDDVPLLDIGDDVVHEQFDIVDTDTSAELVLTFYFSAVEDDGLGKEAAIKEVAKRLNLLDKTVANIVNKFLGQ